MNHECECRRCLNRFGVNDDEKYGTDQKCPICGSTAIESTDGKADELDVLRTGSGG